MQNIIPKEQVYKTEEEVWRWCQVKFLNKPSFGRVAKLSCKKSRQLSDLPELLIPIREWREFIEESKSVSNKLDDNETGFQQWEMPQITTHLEVIPSVVERHRFLNTKLPKVNQMSVLYSYNLRGTPQDSQVFFV